MPEISKIYKIDKDLLKPEDLEDEQIVEKNDPSSRKRKFEGMWDDAPIVPRPNKKDYREAFTAPEDAVQGSENPEDEYLEAIDQKYKEKFLKEKNVKKILFDEISKRHFGLKVEHIIKLPDFVLENLYSYLKVQRLADEYFSKMSVRKKELKSQYSKDKGKSERFTENHIPDVDDYWKYKKRWQKWSKRLRGFQVKDPDAQTPETIKEPKGIKEFVRKYNLSTLNTEHRSFLEEAVDQQVQRRGRNPRDALAREIVEEDLIKKKLRTLVEEQEQMPLRQAA